MSQSSTTQKPTELITAAGDEGIVSVAAVQALNIPDLDEKIGNMGISPDDFPESHTTLITLEVDDSSSIMFAGNDQTLAEGHNQVLDDLQESKTSASILAHTRYLNGTSLYPYTYLDQAIRLTAGGNYIPRGGTPLYDNTIVLLGLVLAKYQDYQDRGISCRTATLIITDGHDEHSTRDQDGSMCKTVIEDLIKLEDHIVLAMGIDDGHTNFQQVFNQMGIPDKWILTPANSAKEIRAAFNEASSSITQASQGAAGFSKVGGFGN